MGYRVPFDDETIDPNRVLASCLGFEDRLQERPARRYIAIIGPRVPKGSNSMAVLLRLASGG